MIEQIPVGELATNCWLFPLENGESGKDGSRPCAVIDPGAEVPVIIARIAELKLYPKYLIFTHGHFDPIGGLVEMAAHYGPSALVAIHKDDEDRIGPAALRSLSADCTSMGIPLDALTGAPSESSSLEAAKKNAVPKADIVLNEGDTIGPFKVLHLPGHTPGCIGLYAEEAGVIFTGDTLFQGDVGRTDLPGGSWKALQKSIERLLALDKKTLVCPGHGPASTIGAEIDFIKSLL